MTTVRVEYARKIGTPDYGSVSIGGSVEVPVPDGADWQSVYLLQLALLKGNVDAQVGAPSEVGAVPTQATPSAPLPTGSAQPSSATAELSQPNPIIPKAAVGPYLALVDGKLFHDGVGTAKERVKVRIKGPTSGFTVDLKSFDTEVITNILNLQLNKGDAIIVRGYFDEPYKGKHDLRAQAVERA